MKKLTFFILAFLFFLIVHCTLVIDNCMCQWVYQSLPSYHDVQDIKFFDTNTGIITLYSYDPGMLRTTNGGNNWTMVNNNIYYGDMQKIDSMTMYLLGKHSGICRIQRTFDRGLTWDSISISDLNTYTGLSFINRDTGWISGANYLSYNCIWKTTNGGVTLIQQTDTTGVGKIFFLKYKINGEYYGWHYSSSGDNKFWKTTNSGNKWFQVTRPPAQYLGYFEFIDENIGWFTWSVSGLGGGIYKTTNGGLNWSNQFVPSGNGIHNPFSKFNIINYDTLYGGGGYITYPNNRNYEIIWKTTNGGLNWGYQEPDTSLNLGGADAVYFLNSLTGWVYGGGNGAHTTIGGGPIIFTEIINHSSNIPKICELKQNYPNPFNAVSSIKYQVSKSSNVKLIVYDLLGKEIVTLVNERKNSGLYEVKFNGANLSSGIYFYTLFVNGMIVDTKKMILLK
jgi:photosystem II stability/assembly factor-like uncharacterized protein